MADTSKVIIFNSPFTNQLAITAVSGRCELTVEEIAKKVVPVGVKYKIIDKSDLPADKTWIDAWEDPTIEDETNTGATLKPVYSFCDKHGLSNNVRTKLRRHMSFGKSIREVKTSHHWVLLRSVSILLV